MAHPVLLAPKAWARGHRHQQHPARGYEMRGVAQSRRVVVEMLEDIERRNHIKGLAPDRRVLEFPDYERNAGRMKRRH